MVRSCSRININGDRKMKKKQFQEPAIKVSFFEKENIVTASGKPLTKEGVGVGTWSFTI